MPTHNEIQSAQRAAQRRDYALLALAASTGRRLSELARLCWDDFTITAESITVTWQRTKGGKTMRDILPASVGEAVSASTAKAILWLTGSKRTSEAPLVELPGVLLGSVNTWVQVAPPLVKDHTPPVLVPIQTALPDASDGSMATDVTSPLFAKPVLRFAAGPSSPMSPEMSGV